ncbi:MAG TPA: hypothetical protein VGN11_09070, partial [Candidatus Baltobacteraceae bacterium]|nr:hypothetical protein [Candidatus Baltobacteraceae bacterium]
ATRDRGLHWKKISPDLTLHLAAHEIITGGITLDGTGAETTDTILDIAPSPIARGTIWIGTDDGLVQITRDGGAHWRNSTPPGIAPYGRFASISPSAHAAGTAYAVYDRHMVGDRAAHIFMTNDYGAHWRSISAGLPADDEARSVFADPKTPHLIYAGLERSLWASWNDGATWERLNSNLPAVSVRDIELQPDTDDLLLATHGRGVWILDDAAPLQQLARARAAGTYLFPLRDALEWNWFSYHGTRADGEGPPYGAIVSYYLDKPARTAPTLDVLDAAGKIVRRFRTHEENGKQVPDLDNNAGVNRFVWDLSGENVREWTSAPKWNRGTFDPGAPVVPGRYTLRLHVDGKNYQQTVNVRQDARTHYTVAELRSRDERITTLIDAFSRIDDSLNVLSDVEAEAPTRAAALEKNGDAQLAASVRQLGESTHALIAGFTSNPQNDQDNDFLPDVLRERLQGQIDTYFDSNAPATAAQMSEDAALLRLTSEKMRAYAAFAKQLGTINAQLKAAHAEPVGAAKNPDD